MWGFSYVPGRALRILAARRWKKILSRLPPKKFSSCWKAEIIFSLAWPGRPLRLAKNFIFKWTWQCQGYRLSLRYQVKGAWANEGVDRVRYKPLNDLTIKVIMFLWSIKVPVGHFVLCDTCDADDIVLTKENARKFHALHGGMHRHPSRRFNLVA